MSRRSTLVISADLDDDHPVVAARRRSTSSAALIVRSALLAAVVTACAGGGDDRPLAPELTEGRAIYRSRCASCHGGDGGGGVGPQLSSGRVEARYPDIRDHIAVVRDGRGAMPSWDGTWSAEEIEAVVRYEREGL